MPSSRDAVEFGEACWAALAGLMPVPVGASLRRYRGCWGVTVVDGGVEPDSCRGRFGLRWIALVPGGGNSQSAARPLVLQRSQGGASGSPSC